MTGDAERGFAAVAKHTVAAGIRRAHKALLTKPLPRKVAIYFHELGAYQWPAFRDAVGYFTDLGYTTVPAHEFASDESDRRLLFVSFDDNFADWHRALDLFDECQVSATFYVNTLVFRDTCTGEVLDGFYERIAQPGKPLTLASKDLADFVAAGHEIGCHSHSHFNLRTLAACQRDREILRSKEILEELTGRPIQAFSYPYGMRRFFSSSLRDYCAGLGFTTIATGIPGLQHGAAIDPLSLHRTRWNLGAPLAENIADLQIDGFLFERLTGRSAVA